MPERKVITYWILPSIHHCGSHFVNLHFVERILKISFTLPNLKGRFAYLLHFHLTQLALFSLPT